MLLAVLHRCKENGVTRAYVEPFDVWRENFYASAGFRTYGKMGDLDFKWKRYRDCLFGDFHDGRQKVDVINLR